MNQTSSEPTIQELFDLSGKSALITGATGWLGSSMARALAEAGASVIISSRDGERAQTAAATLPTPGNATHGGVELDQTDPKSIESGFGDGGSRSPAPTGSTSSSTTASTRWATT